MAPLQKREAFPENEPATRRDFSLLPESKPTPTREREAAREASPVSSWRPRPKMKSETYCIVPGRAGEEEDEGAARSEIATPLPPRPLPPTAEMQRTWRLRLLVGRIGRVSPAELLEVPEDASWATIHTRYMSLVGELRAYRTDDPGVRRRIALLLQGLAEAYEALVATRRRPASATK